MKKNKTSIQGHPLLILFAKEPHISVEIRRDKLYPDSFAELASPNIGGYDTKITCGLIALYTRYPKKSKGDHGE